MKYVVVVRNPEEAIVSFKPFLEAHSLELWKLWDAVDQREKFLKPNFEAFYKECVLPGFPNMPPEAVPPGGLWLTMLFFGFINGWWPLRLRRAAHPLQRDEELTTRAACRSPRTSASSPPPSSGRGSSSTRRSSG